MTLTLKLPAPTDQESGEQREKRLQVAIALYDARLISQGSAAELAGLSRAAFIDALARANIPAAQYTAEEAIAEARR